MEIIAIVIQTVAQLHEFVNECAGIGAEMELCSEGHRANAKSVLEICTLNLSHPLELRISGEEDEVRLALQKLQKYVI